MAEKPTSNSASFNYLKKIPEEFLHFEEVGDQYAIRIKNFGISGVNSANPLVISMRLLSYAHTIYVNSDAPHAFPQNWEPASTDTRFVWRHGGNLIPNQWTRNWVFAGINSGKYYPSTLGLSPSIIYSDLMFQIHS